MITNFKVGDRIRTKNGTMACKFEGKIVKIYDSGLFPVKCITDYGMEFFREFNEIELIESKDNETKE